MTPVLPHPLGAARPWPTCRSARSSRRAPRPIPASDARPRRRAARLRAHARRVGRLSPGRRLAAAEPRPRIDARARRRAASTAQRRAASTSRGGSASACPPATRARSLRRRSSSADVVYLQDMRSNVYALDLETGQGHGGASFRRTQSRARTALAVRRRPRLRRDRLDRLRARRRDRPPALAPLPRHPDGALRRHRAAGRRRARLPRAPSAYPPDGRGVLYALDARTGASAGASTTIEGRMARPGARRAAAAPGTRRASPGGDRLLGHRESVSRTAARRAHPNGGAYAGAGAVHRLAARARRARAAGSRWYDQVTPHDVRDYDFQLPPILGVDRRHADVIFGAGKGGVVIAWDRRRTGGSGRPRSGRHRNDRGPLPSRRVPVCPGLLGGVETPMAYADGRLFVPVVNLCMRGSAVRLRGPRDGRRRRARNGRARGARRARRAGASGLASCRSRTSAARPSPTASSSPRRSTARSTRSTPDRVRCCGSGTLRGGHQRLPRAGPEHVAGRRRRASTARSSGRAHGSDHWLSLLRPSPEAGGVEARSSGEDADQLGSFTVPSACGVSSASEVG